MSALVDEDDELRCGRFKLAREEHEQHEGRTSSSLEVAAVGKAILPGADVRWIEILKSRRLG